MEPRIDKQTVEETDGPDASSNRKPACTRGTCWSSSPCSMSTLPPANPSFRSDSDTHLQSTRLHGKVVVGFSLPAGDERRGLNSPACGTLTPFSGTVPQTSSLTPQTECRHPALDCIGSYGLAWGLASWCCSAISLLPSARRKRWDLQVKFSISGFQRWFSDRCHFEDPVPGIEAQ
jgi:hypothetical protein